MKSSRPLSAHCRSSNARITGSGPGDPLEEQTPAAEQVGAVRRGALLEPEQMRQPWLHEAPLALVADVLLDGGAQLLPRRCRVLLLEDPGAGPHHLRERPVGDALAVGQAAPLVPPPHALDPVDVLEVLPQQPRLPRPGFADHGDQARAPVGSRSPRPIR